MIKRIPFAFLKVILPAGLCALSCCGQLPDYRIFEDVDLKPPVLLKVIPGDETRVLLHFDEPLDEGAEFTISPGLEIETRSIDGGVVELILKDTQTPGYAYILQGRAKDLRGNSLTFLYHFYGYNPNPPGVIINEFINQGSTTHPDIVELKVVSGGNSAGMVLCEGTTDTWTDRFIFPAMELTPGEFLLVHFKPQGIPGEIDETGSLDESAGYDASPHCRDFWVTGGDGIAGNNGVLALYAFPQGPILDGVLFSNRTSLSDTTYRGFGSGAVMDMADQLYEEGGWVVEGELPAPEDGVNPDDSTATRSLCRNREGENTRSRSDWHIVPTSGYTLGTENSDEVYSP